MNGRDLVGKAVTVLVVVLVVAMLLGQLLGQPVLLGYVSTNSMEPTLEPGDGFVAVPAFLMGDPEPGDVVVFRARTLQDGGLTTHRVVAETENGYITRGDNNPFTDQDDDEPPVTDGQIVAYALQVNGEVVAIPELGTVVSGFQSAVAAPFEGIGTDRVGSVLVFAGIALFVLAGLAGDRGHRDTSRGRDREGVIAAWIVVAFSVAVVVTFATAAMVMPAGVHELGLVASDNPTDETQVVRPGENATAEYELHNAGVVPVLAMHQSPRDDVSVDPERVVVGGGDRVPVNVTMQAPGDRGRYLRSVQETRYLLILPVGLLAALHSVHPLLGLVAVDLVVAALVMAVAIAVFGTGQLRLRTGATSVPTRVRLRRRVQQWR
jgi:signal peptidase